MRRNPHLDFFYTRDHIWIQRMNNYRIRIGLTPYAVSELRDIVSLELPEAGSRVRAGHSIGTVESAKTVSDLYCPMNGVIVEVNTLLERSFESLAKDALGEGWIAVIEADQPVDVDGWLKANEYALYIKEE